ncbi:siderophore ABC transporter substrate-binding protein [Brevibacterium yomogidense]|uniref:siderophore ABC transporter substrate-binding protein n=1 Tax=Brevibacterium yomogidense TaxID=946573 RepID=UPI0018DF8817|nr:ABC transporter substrate-binding protein [Brevibacterium yomogidense]
MQRRNRLGVVLASTAALALGLTACGSGSTGEAEAETGDASSTVTVEANSGPVDVAVPPQSVAAFDNRTFKLLDDWGVDLSAGAVSLMRADLSYKDDDQVLDTGNHREPDLESIVEADPDVVIIGQRYTQYEEDIASLAPDAAMLNLDPREDEEFGDELKRQVTELGKVFEKEDEAQTLVDEYDEAVDRVVAAYDSDESVMGVITSGGDINYAAPTEGRTLGPVFDDLGLTPALEVDEASEDHQGDDISVEAIADSNPDWILVMDRDAGVNANSGEEYTPAQDLLADSPALQNVTAVAEGNIVYMPEFTYLDESLATYTEFYNSIADAMEQSN